VENALKLHQLTNADAILDGYEKRKKEIDEIETRKTEKEIKAQEVRAAITERRLTWERPLEHLVKRVSAAFARSFAAIGCAGEVVLFKGGKDDYDSTDDFNKWAIHIKVKFRENERLQLLTAQRQSGGERSVTTIFYLMALQSQAIAPFRVVDEINQGMDPRNERLVHSRIVNAACKSNLQ
jgi:structural maintenance of chromosomes protein 5